MPFLNSYNVLWLVLWSMVLFVVAPHLDSACKPAARVLRLGSFALLADVAMGFALPLARIELLWAYQGVIGALLHAAFWGSLGLAAMQIVKAAPRQRELQ